MQEKNRKSGVIEQADHSLLQEKAALISDIARGFYQRGWVLGTSGNFSSVVSREPLRLAITSSGIDKGLTEPANILEVDEAGNVVSGPGRASAETLLHIAVVRQRRAGAVLHTHSVWSNILSEAYASRGGFEISGYEMLKGLDGIDSHTAREWLPIIGNSQDMTLLGSEVVETLNRFPDCHG